MKIICVLLLTIICTSANVDTTGVYKKIKKNIALRLDNYKGFEKKTLIQRFEIATEEICELQNLYALVDGFGVTDIKPYEIHKSLLSKISDQINKWPIWLKNYCKKSILRIYTCSNFPTNARINLVYDSTAYRFVICLNSNLFDTNPNEWQQKNNLRSIKQKSVPGLSFILETKETNTFENTFEFVFLHEIGHAIGEITSDLPSLWYDNKNWQSDSIYYILSGFLDLMIKKNVDPKIHFADGQFEFDFWGRKKISPKQFISYFTRINNAGFLTLYSTQNIHENYAEAFAYYVHCEELKKPYIIKYEKDGKELLRQNCFENNEYFLYREYFKGIVNWIKMNFGN